MDRIIRSLSSLRVEAAVDESEIQNQIAQCLRQNDLSFEREKCIAPGCRVDFLLPEGIVLEVKARKLSKKILCDQIKKYCFCQQVSALVLVTNQSTAVAKSYYGKPIICIRINPLWGIAL